MPCALPQAHDRPVPHQRGPDCRVTSADGLTGTPHTHCGTPPELRAEAPRAESLHPQPCQAVVRNARRPGVDSRRAGLEGRGPPHPKTPCGEEHRVNRNVKSETRWGLNLDSSIS